MSVKRWTGKMSRPCFWSKGPGRPQDAQIPPRHRTKTGVHPLFSSLNSQLPSNSERPPSALNRSSHDLHSTTIELADFSASSARNHVGPTCRGVVQLAGILNLPGLKLLSVFVVPLRSDKFRGLRNRTLQGKQTHTSLKRFFHVQ